MSHDKDLSANSSPQDQWDRLESELRACKETQQRMWGDIDNATLGRYLSGEMSAEEMTSIEQELQKRPELRMLTDLVRDVLTDMPLEQPEPVAPRVLSFTKTAPHRRRLFDVIRRHASLVAAACLLLIFGAAMPRQAFQSDLEGQPLPAIGTGFASRRIPEGVMEDRGVVPENAPRMMALRTNVRGNPVPAPPQAADPASPLMVAMGNPAQTIPPLTPHQVAALQRRGNDYRLRGEMAKAEKPLMQSYNYCKNRFGSEHPTTRVNAHALADVYATSLVLDTESRDIPAGTPHKDRDSRKLLHQRLARQSVQDIRGQVVPVLIEALHTAPPGQRRKYVRALGQLGPAARPAVPVLAEMLTRSHDAEEQADVLLALEQMGEAARAAVPLLSQVCDRKTGKTTIVLNGELGAKKILHFSRTLPPSEHELACRVLKRLRGCEGRVGIRDEAGCFSLGALHANTRQLHILARETGLEIFLQTVAGDIDQVPSALERMCPRALHIIVAPHVPAAEVRLSKELQNEKFDKQDLVKTILADCQERQFDRALSDTVKQLRGLVKPLPEK